MSIETIKPIKSEVKPVKSGSDDTDSIQPAGGNRRSIIMRSLEALAMVRLIKALGANEDTFKALDDSPVKRVADTLRNIPAIKQSQFLKRALSARALYNVLKSNNQSVKESLTESRDLLSDDDIQIIAEALEQSTEADRLDSFVIAMEQWHKEKNKQKGIK
ncbi:hypothetical protein C9E85_14740 [Plesiomonas shigelloides]|uniref:hypothetical protein n=1 Tax=Plesiomonas shigelloides TaxID=703 RepID=UPI000D57DDDB|nr:hypothetical protein [Plesiomonas shigelloides]PVU65088.1 hypothetical protein C9E85_14740 [Plesiomonas shigelloides]